MAGAGDVVAAEKGLVDGYNSRRRGGWGSRTMLQTREVGGDSTADKSLKVYSVGLVLTEVTGEESDLVSRSETTGLVFIDVCPLKL